MPKAGATRQEKLHVRLLAAFIVLARALARALGLTVGLTVGLTPGSSRPYSPPYRPLWAENAHPPCIASPNRNTITKN